MRQALEQRHGSQLQGKLAAASVAVCGLGGLGSNIALCLARTGIGKLILIDFDRVDITNLRGDNTTPPRRISVAGVLISAGDLPVYDNLGYFVDAYYKETEDGGSKQLVYLSKKANKNQETILKAEDVTSIENGTVKAEDERGKTVSCRYESFAAILRRFQHGTFTG